MPNMIATITPRAPATLPTMVAIFETLFFSFPPPLEDSVGEAKEFGLVVGGSNPFSDEADDEVGTSTEMVDEVRLDRPVEV